MYICSIYFTRFFVEFSKLNQYKTLETSNLISFRRKSFKTMKTKGEFRNSIYGLQRNHSFLHLSDDL